MAEVATAAHWHVIIYNNVIFSQKFLTFKWQNNLATAQTLRLIQIYVMHACAYTVVCICWCQGHEPQKQKIGTRA